MGESVFRESDECKKGNKGEAVIKNKCRGEAQLYQDGISVERTTVSHLISERKHEILQKLFNPTTNVC